jgi:hypothetical protein
MPEDSRLDRHAPLRHSTNSIWRWAGVERDSFLPRRGETLTNSIDAVRQPAGVLRGSVSLAAGYWIFPPWIAFFSL